MSRKYAQIHVQIWLDSDFKERGVDAQWLYIALFSQPNLNVLGILPYTPTRWANLASEMTVERIEAAMLELQEAGYIIFDPVTQEVLVRSYIRHNKVLDNPNMLKKVRADFGEIMSEGVREGVRQGVPEGVSEGVLEGVSEGVREGVLTRDTSTSTSTSTSPLHHQTLSKQGVADRPSACQDATDAPPNSVEDRVKRRGDLETLQPPPPGPSVASALSVLAKRDLAERDNRTDLGPVGNRRAYLARCQEQRVATDMHRLNELAVQHPEMTGDELAELILKDEMAAPRKEPYNPATPCPHCGAQYPGRHRCIMLDYKVFDPEFPDADQSGVDL